MHIVSGRWQLGLALSLITALLWGILPLALKTLLGSLSPVTITWFRFIAALLLLWLWLRMRRSTPDWRALRGKVLGLLLLAAMGLVGNYVCYLIAITHITPSGAQSLIQMAPMLFLLGSVWLFRESFNRWQWAGFAVFVLGLLLFFNLRLRALAEQQDFVIGLLWMIVASITWAVYALAQKALLKTFSSPQVMVMLYLMAAVALTPFAHPEQKAALDQTGLWLLLFACANTLLAYGAFAEALAHWQASRVSATLAITPLITMGATAVADMIWPGSVAVEPLNALAYFGAALVVGGSMLSALKR